MTVQELVEELKSFDQSMPVIIGVDGIFQGPPEEIIVQDTDDGKAVIMWVH